MPINAPSPALAKAILQNVLRTLRDDPAARRLITQAPDAERVQAWLRRNGYPGISPAIVDRAIELRADSSLRRAA